MAYLLNLVYLALLAAAFPWFVCQAIRKGKYREGFAAKFFGRVPRRRGDRRCVWLHAVSVGEVNLLGSLLHEIAREKPDWECVVSTTTMTGMALARKKYPHLAPFYCPLDFSWAVRTAMRRIRPDLLVLAELELWPNLVRAARRSGARVAVINGRLSERSYRGYRRLQPLLAGMLRRIDLIAAQDETYAARFCALGAAAESVHVTGSMKYDGAETDRNNPVTQRLRRLAGFAEDDVVFLAGSTQEPEEALALAAWRELSPRWPQLRLVLVPRHPDRFDAVARLLDASGVPWQRRTALEEPSLAATGNAAPSLIGASCAGPIPLGPIPPGPTSERTKEPTKAARSSAGGWSKGVAESGSGPIPNRTCGDWPHDDRAYGNRTCDDRDGGDLACGARASGTRTCGDWAGEDSRSSVLLVDVVGELGAWWGTAQIAFVGGSMGTRGGQNMIEPAAYGAAVSFGPNTHNFRDIVAAMLARGAAVVVRDGEEMTAFVRRCLEDPAYRDRLGSRARALVAEQLGATRRTFGLLAPLVDR